jgi:hypothetical protein
MKEKKSKLIAVLGGVGALCALCCSLPILGFLGFGALEVFFCENEMLKGMGITLMLGSVIYLGIRIYNRRKGNTNSCAINCGCKAS